MKLNRRILSLVLVLCILLTLVPIQAMAVPITGTVGPGGAPWRLYDDGTLIVEPGHIDWDHTESPWHVHSDDISTIEFTGPIAAGPHLQNLFNGLSNVHTITGLEHFDTSGVTTMANMFRDAIRLTSLNLSGWDTSNVTNMSLMFSGTALRQLTLGEEFAFIDGTAAALPAVPNSDGYTGRWQNIGNGTIYAPAGSYELTSAELMDEFDGPDMADTWIWQWSHGLASLEDHVFPSAILGYDPQMPHTVIVTSTGAQPTGNLTITVTTVAGNNNAFTFSMNLLASILSPGGTASFTVTPNPGLPVGTHTVEVTVHNANGISEVFTVSFTVNPLSPHTVTFALNGGTYNGNQALLVQTVPHGQNATALSGNPSRPGFTFIGWAPALNLENVTENRTFVAQWRLIQGPQPTPTPPGNGDLPQREAFLIGVGDAGYPIPINPRGNITRAEVATIFFRLVEDEVRYEYWTQEHPYTDVELEQWFNNAVSTTTNLGLFEGIGDDLFAPLNNITRGELAAVLVRFMERDQIGPFETSDDADDDLFNDIADHWARAYINRAAEAGWIEGAEGLGGPFRPGDPLERAEAAAMINRMFERLIETPDCRLYDMVTWPDNPEAPEGEENSWYFLYMYMATNSYRYRWRTDSDRYKELVQIIEPREWWRLERPDSVPADIFIRGE